MHRVQMALIDKLMSLNNHTKRWGWGDLLFILIINSVALWLAYYQKWTSVDILFLYLTETIVGWVYIESVYIYHWWRKDIVTELSGFLVIQRLFITLWFILVSGYMIFEIFGWTDKLLPIFLVSAIATILRLGASFLFSGNLDKLFSLRNINFARLGLVVLIGSSAAAFLVYDDLAKFYIVLYFVGIRFIVDIAIWFYSELTKDSYRTYKREEFPLSKS